MTIEEKRADETLEAAEREHILRALRESHGQIGGPKGAARRLGLKRTTLQSKVKHFGINPRGKPAGREGSNGSPAAPRVCTLFLLLFTSWHLKNPGWGGTCKRG